MQFVIYHGSFGSPEENWFPFLKKGLEKLEQKVTIPAFPVDTWDNIVGRGEGYISSLQNLTNWLNTFETNVLPMLNRKEKMVFVGHSIASIFMLHLVDRYDLQLDSAIFVSPFLSALSKWEFNAVNETFYKIDFDFLKLKQLIPISYAVYSDNDPYVPQNKFIEFTERVGSSPIIIKEGGHLNTSSGFREFPLLLELCKTRLPHMLNS